VVASVAYGRFLYERGQKRRRLETYLKNDPHRGGRSLLDLATTLGMTETEIEQINVRRKDLCGRRSSCEKR
jgi:hypothetical protein